MPPARLGAYLRDFDALMADTASPDCPTAISATVACTSGSTFRCEKPGGAKVFREFLVAAADLVAGYGGSLSGEHGDGRARGELLPTMYSADALRLFGAVKNVFDPENILNPGVIVDPRPLDADLREPPRRSGAGTWHWPTTATAGISPRRCTAAPGSVSAVPTTPRRAG